jgi:hypothetical protein
MYNRFHNISLRADSIESQSRSAKTNYYSERPQSYRFSMVDPDLDNTCTRKVWPTNRKKKEPQSRSAKTNFCSERPQRYIENSLWKIRISESMANTQEKEKEPGIPEKF